MTKTAKGSVTDISASGASEVIKPEGRDQLYKVILETAPDAIVLVGRTGNILLHNRATKDMFGYSGKELDRLEIEELLPGSMRDSHREYRTQFQGHPRTRHMGTGLDLRGRKKDGTEFHVDIMLSPISIGQDLLVIAVIRDNTAKQKEKRILEKALQTLQAERAKVQALKGLLPICAWCKSVRDDGGYWSRVEEYFHEHAEVDFTHGICPDCARKFAERRPTGATTVPARGVRKRVTKK